MLLRVCAVLDKGASMYGQPMFVRHVAEAVRACQQATRDGKSMMAQYPEQFSLWHVADFDDVAGTFENVGTLLAQVTSLKTSE